ncbi:MAG: hypothetical protein MJ078_05060, partial [Clostridia bacterium]|nr:hypothetical protein [Clostridia bacterium]
VLAPAQKDALTVEGYDGEIENHWMYQVQKSLIFANTVLRSHPSVKEDQVGITGISWGGFGMSFAICYDARYAFGIPVYISANTDDSQTRSLNNLYQNPFLAALWQNDELLKQVSMPVLVINSDMDLYTSVDVSAMTAGMVQNGKVCIIHKLSHSQQQGAALSEIYLFADEVLGISHRLPELTRQPSAESGHSFTLEIKENAELSEYRATLYYLNNPVTCLNHAANADSFLAEEWNEVPLLIDGEKIKVELPETVAVYYIQLSAFNEKESKVKDVYTGITYGNDGRITVSTDLVSSFPGMFCE